MFENIDEAQGQSIFESPEAKLGEDSLWDDFADSLARSTGNIIRQGIEGTKNLLGKYGTSPLTAAILKLNPEAQKRNIEVVNYLFQPTAKLVDELAWAEKGFAEEKMQDPTDSFAEFAVEAIGGAAPYMAAVIASGGTSALAGAPAWLGSSLFGFTVMGQDAYENAIAQGATENQAEVERYIVGGINALIETMQLGSMMKGAKGGGEVVKGVLNQAKKKTWEEVFKAGGKFSWKMVRTGLEEALEEALQGTVSEGFPAMFRGQEIEGGMVGFATRRAYEALGGGIAGMAFGGLGSISPTVQQYMDDKSKRKNGEEKYIIDLAKDPAFLMGDESVEDAVTSLTEAGLTDAEQFQVIDEARTLANEIDSGTMTQEEAEGHIKEAGLNRTPDQVRILGENVRDSANKALFKLYKGANADTVVHEFAEDYFKAQYGEEANVEEISNLRQQYEQETGNMFDGNNREWLANLASEYALKGTLDGQSIQTPNSLFTKFKQLINRLFAGTFKIKEGIRSGTVENLTNVLKEPFTKSETEGKQTRRTFNLSAAENKMLATHTPSASIGEAQAAFIMSDGSVIPLGFQGHETAAEAAGTTIGQVLKGGGIRLSGKGNQLIVEAKTELTPSQVNKVRQWVSAKLKEQGDILLTTDIKGNVSGSLIDSGTMLSEAMGKLGKEVARSFKLEDMSEEEQQADALNGGEEISPVERTEEEEIAITEELEELMLNKGKSSEDIDKLASSGVAVLMDRWKQEIPEAQAQFEEMTSEVRKKITKEGTKVSGKLRGQDRVKAIKKIMAQKAEDPYFKPFTVEEVSPAQRDAMHDKINKAFQDGKLQFFETARADEFLDDVLAGRRPRNPGSSKLLDLVFGKEFGNTVRKRMAKKDTLKKQAISWLNLPQALQAGGEMSMVLRQGIISAFAHPKIWFGEVQSGFKTLQNIDTARKIQMAYRTDYRAKERRKYGVADTDFESVELTDKEEGNQTDLIEKWANTENPYAKYTGFKSIGQWMAKTQRAYTIFTNGLRANLWNHFADSWEGQARTEKDYDQLAKFVNAVTGRGEIGWLKEHAPTLNALFFSPYLLAGRVQTVSMLVDPRTTMAVRKIVAKDLAKFTLGSFAILALIKMFIPEAEVEDDPRSADFGKVKFGNTRYDFLGGYAPLIRTVVRTVSGQTKSTVTGQIKDTNRREEILRFFRAKLSPIASTAVDIATGETFLGEELGLTEDLTDEGNLTNYISRKFIPFFAQDIAEAFAYEGVNNGLLSIPSSFFGLGVQTYEYTPYNRQQDVRNHYSSEVFGKQWTDLGPEAQEALRQAYPMIQKVEDEASTANSNYDFVGEMLKEQQAAGKKVLDTLPKDVKQYLKSRNLTVGGLSRRVGTNWSLNDKRYEQYIADTGLVLNAMLPELVRSPEFTRLDNKTQQLMIEYLVDGVKKEIRNRIVYQSNIEDLQELNND